MSCSARMWITPDWPAPQNVRALSTTRLGGHSEPPYQALNLGLNGGDDADTVVRNRRTLLREANLPQTPCWLRQVHGSDVVDLDTNKVPCPPADGAFTRQPHRVCAVLTADCLPILLCSADGNQVAALHGGWRGLAAGVIAQGVRQFDTHRGLVAWLGPAISVDHYEVGPEVRAAFAAIDRALLSCFIPSRPGHWHADLYGLARHLLQRAGVNSVSGGQHCTFRDSAHFYSFRRQAITGRQATLVWIDSNGA